VLSLAVVRSLAASSQGTAMDGLSRQRAKQSERDRGEMMLGLGFGRFGAVLTQPMDADGGTMQIRWPGMPGGIVTDRQAGCGSQQSWAAC
jgi:hypothetical protein